MQKPTHPIQIIFAVGIFTFLFSQQGFAQNRPSADSGYYITFPQHLILRAYLSRKFAPLTISSSNKEDLNYKTNSKLSLGAGFTYKIVTLNFAYGLSSSIKIKAGATLKGLISSCTFIPASGPLTF